MANATKSQATPGPWRVGERNRMGGYSINAAGSTPDSHVRVADTYDTNRTDWSEEVTARLIAAAPQMREALEQCIRAMTGPADRPHGITDRSLAKTVALAALRAAGGE